MQHSEIPVPATFKKALALHQGGQLASAEVLYRQILGVAPNHAGALHLLGLIAHSAAQNAESIELIRAAIKANPSNASYYNNLAGVLRAEHRIDDAIAMYRKAIAIDSSYAEAHSNLGNVYNDIGRVNAALASYQRAIALKPDAAPFKTNFAQCIANVTFGRAIEPAIRNLLTRAMAEAWARPADLAKVSLSLLKVDTTLGPCIDRASAAWPTRLTSDELFGPSGPRAIADDPLLHALLENAQISDPAFERFLTTARCTLTLAAANDDPGDDANEAARLTLSSAIAQQCFISDYVFDSTEEETACIASMRETLMSDCRREPKRAASRLAAIAAHGPLVSVPDIESITSMQWPACVTALLRQQIVEPLEERAYRTTIRCLTSIADDVSKRVQRQYEESPYPRWVKLPILEPPRAMATYLQRHFPLASHNALASKSRIDTLVAGCGTGQESNEIAHQIAGSRVLAIDLSIASLCYAKRKARELGLNNIEYAQADLLQLHSIGTNFDFISASGVLHHLADPMTGLSTLHSLLRPGGLMRLAVYSETARQSVVAARELIAERGYEATPDGIRRCRQALLSDANVERFGQLTTSRDFYVMGECRDLLFHVQEQRFTLPRIAEMLRELHLEFCGFSLKAHVTARFAERYPADRAQIDLDHWHAFEMQFPATFAGMYQFLVRKRA